MELDTRYPSLDDLKKKALKRIPKFAFEYLIGGANEEINLARNKSDIQEVILMPEYLREFDSSEPGTELLGYQYDAPFGISPIGLQGLIWPNAPEILAKAAVKNNIPLLRVSSALVRLQKVNFGFNFTILLKTILEMIY